MNLRQSLSRRTVLRGLGVSLSLPFLEAMLPKSLSAAASMAIPARSAVFYFGTGMNMRLFTPQDEGRNFTLTPTLEPFAPFRDQMTVLSGTYLEHGGGHGGDYPFLTGTSAGATKMTISADQIAAAQIGHHTRFPSLQFSETKGTGYPGNVSTLSWSEQGIPLPAENDPKAIFDRLFAPVSAEEQRLNEHRFRQRASILDGLVGKAKDLEKKISATDKSKLDEFMTSIRGVESELQRDIAWATTPKPNPTTAGMGDFQQKFNPIEDARRYFHLMYDLTTLAFQTDSTRLITFMVRVESAGGALVTTKMQNLAGNFHSLTHHGEDPVKLRDLARIDRVYMEHFAHVLEGLSAMKEPDGSSVLDHTMLAFSSGMGIGHSRDLLPTAIFGGSALGIEHQGHLKLPPNTPLSSLWHTMLDRMQVQVPKDFQDSPGPIKQLIKA
jgi:hypothetical protein